MIWLVPNNKFWLVGVNHFWLVDGLGPVRSDSGVFVCDRFFAFGNNRLFPERGSFMSGSEMRGARFNMAIKVCNFIVWITMLWSCVLHSFDKFCGTSVALLKCPVCGAVIILCDRSEMTSSEWNRCELCLTLSLILMTNTVIRKHWLTWLAFPAVAPGGLPYYAVA